MGLCDQALYQGDTDVNPGLPMNGSDDISLGLPSPLTLEFDCDVPGLVDWWVQGTVQAQDCVFHGYTFFMTQKQAPGQETDCDSSANISFKVQ